MRSVYVRAIITLSIIAMVVSGCVGLNSVRVFCDYVIVDYSVSDAFPGQDELIEVVREEDGVVVGRKLVEDVEVTSSTVLEIPLDEPQAEGTRLYVRIADDDDRSSAYVCAGFNSEDNQTGFFEPEDGRINPQTYATATIYCDSTNGQVAIYGVYPPSAGEQAGQGYPAIFVNYGDLPETPVGTNVLIEAFNNIRFYRLISGEYQVNVGPDAEGKEYVAVFDGCPHSYLNVYTLQNGVLIPAESVTP